jgi:glycosyltransferase involved in cell wall biosynthesis
LADTLSSVERQEYPDVEHIVIDDGSTDDSATVLAAWPGRRLRWISTPNQGQARALNDAFRLSSGDIIGWLSSDDAYYDREVVRAAADAFARYPRAVLVYGHAVLIDDNGLQLQAQWVPPVDVLGYQPPMHILQPAAFVRRSALGDRLVDESFDLAMDTELWLRLRGPGAFVRLDRILAAERHHAHRKSITGQLAAAEEARRLDLAYRPARGRRTHRRNKAWGIAYRLAGLALLPRMERHPNAFDGGLDSRIALLRRQIAAPRSRMAADRDRARS